MSDEEYEFEEMDALTAFLDEEAERNPYDHEDEDPGKKRASSSIEEIPESKPMGEFANEHKLEGGVKEEDDDEDQFADERKSREELIEELQMLRRELKKLKNEKEQRSQGSQELFSLALSGSLDSPTLTKSLQKKRSGATKRKPNAPHGGQKQSNGSEVKTKQNMIVVDVKSKAVVNTTMEKLVETEGRTNSIPDEMQDSVAEDIPTGTEKPTKSFQEMFGSLESSEKDEESNSKDAIKKDSRNTEEGAITAETTEEKTNSKTSFLEMFGSLANSDEETESTSKDNQEREKKAKSMRNGKTEPVEEKMCNLGGSSSSFYQTTKKRVAHTPKQSPPKGSQANSKDPHRKAVVSSRTGKSSHSLSTEEPWEVEYYSKIRISNPVVSMSALKVKMQQRKMLRLSILKRHIKGADVEGDWVTIGVVISKSTPKTSKTGKQFSIWKLNDLSSNCPVVALFLFGKSHEDHWKTTEGSVVGLLNAKVMPPKGGSDDISLSVDNPQKLLVLGKSKDLGWCKGSKKDGGRCTMFVNKAECEWCDYHIQTQYKKQCSKRTDLNTSFSGLNPTTALKKATQNFIYKGRMYNPTERIKPAKNPNKNITMKKLSLKYTNEIKEELKPKCVTLLSKDKLEDDTLVKVSGSTKEFHSLLSQPSTGSQNFIRHMVETEKAQNTVPIAAADLLKDHRKKVLSLIKSRKMKKDVTAAKEGNKENSPEVMKQEDKREKGTQEKNRQDVILDRLKQGIKSARTRESVGEKVEGPVLGLNLKPGDDIDLSEDINVVRFKRSHRMTREELSKAKAKALVKRKGQFEKPDPNETQRRKKRLDERTLKEIKKRTELNLKSLSDEKEEEEQPPKKRQKLFLGEVIDIDSEEVQAILSGSSIYESELQAELEEKYFSDMEQKEKLELKMDAIMEKEVKVVSCHQCKFTWFGPSSLCKANNHKLNWHNAVQRFFKCQGCQIRSISFFRYPTKHCRNCKGTKFTRVSMLNVREKKEETLLLRGEERKWIN